MAPSKIQLPAEIIPEGATLSSYNTGRLLEPSPPAAMDIYQARDTEFHLRTKDHPQARRDGAPKSAVRKLEREQTQRIEESHSGAIQYLDTKTDETSAEWSSHGNYATLMRELESVKRELNELKVKMASFLEEKRKADKDQGPSLSRSQSCCSSVAELHKEIEDINEEHLLVDLARMEAIKEYEQVEAQRMEKAEKFSAKIEEARKKAQDMVQDIADETELEKEVARTMSEVNSLNSEIKQVKVADMAIKTKTWGDQIESDSQQQDEPASESLLASILNELEAAKNETNSVKEDSFQYMASMDIIRNEQKQVGDELSRLKNKEKTLEMAIENLKSKLLRAKAKLEATSAAEQKTKSIASNLSLALEQLKVDDEEAKKERSMITEEIALIRAEVQRTETEIYVAEERLHIAQEDLRVAKSLEATALENLKALTEKTMRHRASSSQPRSRITISRFEYEYLTEHASGAQEIADKKVAATQAWIEALKASEKESQIKSELLRRENIQLRMEEEHITKRSMSINKMAEGDFEKWRQCMETKKVKPEIALPTKVTNMSAKMTPKRRGRARVPASPLVRGLPRSTSITVRRRRKIMRNLGNLFRGKSTDKHP